MSANSTEPGPLHIYEFQTNEGPKHVVALLDPSLVHDEGIPDACVLGEFDPDGQGQFDPKTFRRNDAFVLAFRDYMNTRLNDSDDIHQLAAQKPGLPLYLIDPRHQNDELLDEAEPEVPEAVDVVGCYYVDSSGQIRANSFEPNEHHRLFHAQKGVSGILTQALHDWIVQREGL